MGSNVGPTWDLPGSNVSNSVPSTSTAFSPDYHISTQVMPQPQPQPAAAARANYDPSDVLLRVSQEQAERSDAPDVAPQSGPQSGPHLVGRHEVSSTLVMMYTL